VVHEIPGLHPGVIDFGRRLIDAGYTAYLPSLFGRAGKAPTTVATLQSVLRVCVAREFRILADRTSPVVNWLRALAAKAHAECGGAGVGAVGMCLTGGFALAMAVEASVLAPVLSQPGLPAPVIARKRAALGLDAVDLAAIKDRAQHGLCILGLRFSNDKGCPAERFTTLQHFRRRVRRNRDRLLAGKPLRNPDASPRGADRRLRRRTGPPDPHRARPRSRLPE